jgi:hypothetical protein
VLNASFILIPDKLNFWSSLEIAIGNVSDQLPPDHSLPNTSQKSYCAEARIPECGVWF